MTIQKLLAALLVLVCVFCFTACNNTPDVQYTDPSGETTTTTRDLDYNVGALSEVDAVLNSLETIEVGAETATVAATKVAVDILTLCNDTTRLGSELAHAAQTYYNALSADAKPLFSDRLSIVADAVATLQNEETKEAALKEAQLDTTLEWKSLAFDKAVFILRADK